METVHLATGHVFETLGSIGIIASLLFAAVELHHVVKAQRVGNLFAITRQHREIWSELFRRPDLKRVIDPAADLAKQAVTTEESLFVTFLILHLDAVFKANHARMFVPTASLQKDIAWFFALPIPKTVWESAREMQDADFVAFVETCLSS